MTNPPPSPPRAGLGEWPVWGDEPPELWFGHVPSGPLPPNVAGLPRWPPPSPVARPSASPLAVTGFILGLLGACLSWVPLVGLGSALFGAVLSMHARRLVAPGHQGQALPTAGLILGCIGIAFGVSASAIFATVALNALLSAAYGG